MNFSDLEKIGAGKTLQLFEDRPLKYLVIDSRKALVNNDSLFIAIAGTRNDGHDYIAQLYKIGIRQFVVEKKIDVSGFSEGNFLIANSGVRALQIIVQHHRKQFAIPVIGITGSNGKTIIKEWLSQLLSPDFSIIKNPGSYNSQVGVPLSVWGMESHHQLGIFEAGVSQPGEMNALAKIIEPTIGVFTNIGTAHDEGFATLEEKIKEKLKLFSSVGKLIYCADHTAVHQAVLKSGIPKFSWGESAEADIQIRTIANGYEVSFKEKSFSIFIPLFDAASKENAMHCVAVMLWLGCHSETICKRIGSLKPISMRLELKEGINQCQLIDDTYNNDLGGFQISLDFLSSFEKKKTVIISDVLQSGVSDELLAKTISGLLVNKEVGKLIAIGPILFAQQKPFESIATSFFFKSTQEFLDHFDFQSFQQELILIKGARAFLFEKIVQRLQRKVHGTVMEIDMGKMVHNLNFVKSKLKPGVKLMAMVKAFAYGSGSEEVAHLLQYHKVDYLGVAYPDEGVELRKKNISLPIMVMNPAEESFDAILKYSLEPVLHSIKTLRSFVAFVEGKDAAVHLEVETGLHRLGLEDEDLLEAIELLKQHRNIVVKSVFSHLSASDEKKHDQFSKDQFARFTKSYKLISSSLAIAPLRHILNSAGIIRFADFQMDMVRLGIGLYGVDPTEEKSNAFEMAATLKTVISQIKKVKAGETIGYGRRGVAEKEMTTATIAIGYADGFSRNFSNGKGCVLINGKRARVIGNVNMDMTMIDITDINATEGDEVIIFGGGLSIHEVASSIGTIPYEILTSTSERVKRVFVSEGI